MNIIFKYNRERDIRCILSKGKASNNSQKATRVYEQLAAKYGENPAIEDIDTFIEAYITEKQINIEEYLDSYQKEWGRIADAYQKRAEKIFNTILPNDVVGYLTINNRCPYSIEDNLFYISFPSTSPNKTVTHELWHFYTWYGLGIGEQERLGKEQYNDLKEALTVLLNIECADLLGEGVVDSGYPQHAKLRKEIEKFWLQEKDITKLWAHFSTKENLVDPKDSNLAS